MNILFGVTGGISAYKAADIICGLKRYNHDIKVIMTEKAKNFITPLTLATLSKNQIFDDIIEWDPHGRIDHVELSDWSDFFIIAPTTANTIAKMANGIADNLLTSAYLAFNYHFKYNKRVFICPAMNTLMWTDITTERNIKTLSIKSNHIIIPPIEGDLACGTKGIGKLAPTKMIIDEIYTYYKQ